MDERTYQWTKREMDERTIGQSGEMEDSTIGRRGGWMRGQWAERKVERRDDSQMNKEGDV